MRLRLTVHRQGLPPVQLLWTAGGLRPSQDSAESSSTISQLLDQINEVIPLEAEEWGLDDYVVEVRGFECLHFCVLSHILKEDDEVTIRPLQTTDIRYRKLSGRHQISADGKHLIDGVAFGRPFLRRAERPAIRIASRKRTRLTYEEDNEVPYGNQQLVVRADTIDADEEEEGSEADHDYEYTGFDDTSLVSELENLTSEAEHTGEVPGHGDLGDPMEGGGGAKRETTGRVTRSQKRQRTQGLGIEEASSGSKSGQEQLFSGAYRNPLLDQYYQDEPEYTVNNRMGNWKRDSMEENPYESGPGPSRKSGISRSNVSSARTKSVQFGDDVLETPTTIHCHEESDESDDRDFDPGSDADSEATESNKENIAPQPRPSDHESALLHQSEITGPSSSSDTDSDSSETTSALSTSSDSSSSSGSTSNSDLEPKNSAYKQDLKIAETAESKKSATAPSQNQYKAESKMHAVIPPGKGKQATRSRNARRQLQRKLEHYKSAGAMASTATGADLRQWVAAREASKQEMMAKDRTLQDDEGTDLRAAFEEKRQSLLQSIAQGGVKVDDSERMLDPETRTVSCQNVSKGLGVEQEKGLSSTQRVAHKTLETHTERVLSGKATYVSSGSIGPSQAMPPGHTSPKRRAKIDLDSSRRLLFGSLGLRTPKSKEEEIKLREKLMESIKPIAVGLGRSKDLIDDSRKLSAEEANDDTWEEKIILKAVECCHDDVTLSQPPFPFVQRWDPQQQGYLGSGNGKRGKKRKNKERQEYGGDPAHEYSHQNPGNGVNTSAYDHDIIAEDMDQGSGPIEPGEKREYHHAVHEQLVQDLQEQTTMLPIDSVPDLPELSTDLSIYAALVREEVVPGAIIAFKQLDMSQQTNWQPVLSEYRTAKIDTVTDDGLMELTLARRDRASSCKQYDADTGERIYAKFEMPDSENEHSDEDDGFVEISYAEMNEPLLVKKAEPGLSEQQNSSADVLEIEMGDMSGKVGNKENGQKKGLEELPSHGKIRVSREDADSLDLPVVSEIEMIDMSGIADEDDEHNSISQSDLGQQDQSLLSYEDPEVLESPRVCDAGDPTMCGTNITISKGTSEPLKPQDLLKANEGPRLENSVLAEDVAWSKLEALDGVSEKPGMELPEIASPKFNGFSLSPPHPVTRNQSIRGTDVGMQMPTPRKTNGLARRENTSSPLQEPNALRSDVATHEHFSVDQESLFEANEPEDMENSFEGIDGSFHDDDDDDDEIMPGGSPKSEYQNLHSYIDESPEEPMEAIVEGSAQPATIEAVISDPAELIPRGVGFDSKAKSFLSDFEAPSDSDSDSLRGIDAIFSTAPSQAKVSSPVERKDHRPRATTDRTTPLKLKRISKEPKAHYSHISPAKVQAKSKSPSEADSIPFALSQNPATYTSSNNSDGAFEPAPRVRKRSGTSKVVDLTFSSDAAPPSGSEYEEGRGKSKGLPTGPGWVKKTRSTMAGKKGKRISGV